MNPQIEQLKEDIAILQEKLNKLEDIEKRNAIPRMKFELGGKFEIVYYNGENYYRYQFNDKSFSWYKRKHTDDGMMLVRITDGETRFLLEGVWYNDVEMKRAKKGFQPKPQSPEEVAEGLRDAMRQAKEDGVFDEPTKPMAEVRAALSEREPEGPTDIELLSMAGTAIGHEIEFGEYEPETECAVEAYGSELIDFARAVLARWGRPAPVPADSEEVEELVE